jgi:drug/metabolite transporter (DMT)-like permease
MASIDTGDIPVQTGATTVAAAERPKRKPILPPILIHGPIASLFWATLSMGLLAGLGGFGKLLTVNGVPPFEVVFLRNFFCMLFLLPLLFWRGRALLRSEQLPLYGFRTFMSFVSMTAWFSALAMVPLAQLQAIGFLAPIFATVGAIFLLNERVTVPRWIAIAMGLFGAFIILRPLGGGFGYGQILALVAAFLSGLINPLIKQLTGNDDPDKIVFLTHLYLTPLSLIPALFVWEWPRWELWPYAVGLGISAFLGHLAMVRGIAAAAASLASCFEFSRLPFAVIIGSYVFGEVTDLWTWLGAAVIFSAALYVTRTETRENASAVVAYVGRMKNEMQSLFVRNVANSQRIVTFANAPGFNKMLAENKIFLGGVK